MLYRLKIKLENIRLNLYYIFNVKLSRFTPPKKRILIIKNDAIGDYIIFRNFLTAIKKSENYRCYELCFLTSEKVYSIAKELDGDLYEKIILNTYNKIETIDKKISFFKQLNQLNFEIIIVPSFSPDVKTQEILKHTRAIYKFGFVGDTSNQSNEQKMYYEKYYTFKLPVNNERFHELEKLTDFFCEFVNQKLDVVKPEISLRKTENVNAIVFCPGAGHAFRMWPTQNISELIKLIVARYSNTTIIIATSKNEEYLYNDIKEIVSVPIVNYQIQSTIGLAQLFLNSKLVVCNDSSAAHIAVASGAQSICISNGNNYNRFIPYPEYINSKQIVLLPDSIKNMSDKEQKKLYFRSDIDIKLISVECVYNACQKILDDK